MSGVGPVITAAEVACALGDNLEACLHSIEHRVSGLRPLAGLFGAKSEFGHLLGGWIPDRRLLLGRRYGMSSNLAVRVSRAAARSAGWTASELRGAALFVGSSRGNAGEIFGLSTQRRPIKLFRASNLMHSEIAAAVSIELGVRGPWHVLSNGCASGLDALGFAWMALTSGQVDRALVVSVDLPLVPELLSAFHASGVLSRNNVNDPYHPETSGFLPAEAAVALTLERGGAERGWAGVEAYAVTSDAYDPIGLPEDGAGMMECMERALNCSASGGVAGICPHATGTVSHAKAETAALKRMGGALSSAGCVLMKPYTGHTLGASGLLDVALLSAFARRGELLPNLPHLSAGETSLPVLPEPRELQLGDRILKLSVGMGGHNAAIILRSVRSHRGSEGSP